MREAINLMTADEFQSRVRAAKPGEKIVYHRGLLMHQRQHNKTLRELGVVTFAAWTDGLVHLLQRRVNEFSCEYIAVRK